MVSACASANHAMSQAFDMVRSGKVDFAVTGGTEACVTEPTMKAWEAMRVTADDTCRPFCKQRRGMVLGEGAGIFVLEEYEHARRRGATILAEFAGAGMTADAGDMVFPSEVTVARAMQHALTDAGLGVDEIDYINAHGTGTPANDPTETQSDPPCVRRARGQACGVVDQIHARPRARRGRRDRTRRRDRRAARRHRPADREFHRSRIPNAISTTCPTSRARRIVRAALSNSFAFGGLNSVIALRQAP